MKYQLVGSSRSRVTEVYRGADGTLVEVYHCKSGRIEARPVAEIPAELTVRYSDGDVIEADPITAPVAFPATY